MRITATVHDDREHAGVSRATRWNIAAAGIAVVTSAGVLLAPWGESVSTDANGIQTTTTSSLLSNEGASVLYVIAIPVLLVLLPLALPNEKASYRARATIVVLLSIFIVLGALTIGIFFIPTCIAMGVSLSAQQSTRPSLAPPPPLPPSGHSTTTDPEGWGADSTNVL